MISDPTLDLSFTYDRFENPAMRLDGTEAKKDDYRTLIGIGYKF